MMKEINTWMGMDLEKTVFLTMDIDWVCDEALLAAIDLLGSLDVKATVFATHDTPALDKFRDADFELAIHPNFNELFKGENGETALEIVTKFNTFIPEAKCVRSHSLSSGSVLSGIFKEQGFTYESNVMVPYTSGMELRPYEAPKGLLQLPYNWGDYTYLQNPEGMNVDEYLSIPGLKIMNFHPIHLFLNTNGIDLYNSAKTFTTQYDQLKEYVNQEEDGIGDFLREFVKHAREKGFTFSKLGDIPSQT